MRHRLPLVLAATALALAALGSTSLGQAARQTISKAVPLAKVALFADNAGKLSGHKASTNPKAGQIPVIGSTGKLPASIIPAGSGGGGGGTGSAGPTGPAGATGATGPAGPSSAYSAYKNGPISVTTLPSPSPDVSLAIPNAGFYVIVAKAYAVDTVAGAVSVSCLLSAGGDNDTTQVSLTGTSSSSVQYQSMAFNVVHQFAGSGSVAFGCIASASGAQMKDVKITAIAVGSLTNTAA